MMPAAAIPRLRDLDAWLDHISALSPNTIELGLSRTRCVAEAMGLNPTFPVITVAGTNGKGSTCALLEGILSKAGYRVGLYTSPHLMRYNERVRVNCTQATDLALCQAFDEVERMRGNLPLTYFEFGTLAAMRVFIESKVDLAVLEVGLGGRLDAVNVFDADCAVVTGIDLDHMDYLGDTREQIAVEKAGIFRHDRPAVCAEPNIPETMTQHAASIGARLKCLGTDFGYVAGDKNWQYWDAQGVTYDDLPYPALQGAHQLQNASGCLSALLELKSRLPVTADAIVAGLTETGLPGRFQVLPGSPPIILDVAHNPQAARALAGNLKNSPVSGKTFAVFAMLKDKDIAGVIQAIKHQVDVWAIAGLDGQRGASERELLAILQAEHPSVDVSIHSTPARALDRTLKLAGPKDRIVVFGSFHTVGSVAEWLESPS